MTTNTAELDLGTISGKMLQALVSPSSDGEVLSDQLETLIDEYNSLEPESEQMWIAALIEVLGENDLSHPHIWHGLEMLLAGTGLRPRGLIDIIEQSIANDEILDAEARTIAYEVLLSSGGWITPGMLLEDEASKNSSPLRWLDLFLDIAPDVDMCREEVLDLMSKRQLDVGTIAARLERIMPLADGEPRKWVRAISQNLPIEERREFLSLIDESMDLERAFRIGATTAGKRDRFVERSVARVKENKQRLMETAD